MVAAEADRVKSITAANTNDRALIFIKSPLVFLQKNGTAPMRISREMRTEIRISLDSQIVFELKNGRLIAQALGKLARSFLDQKSGLGVENAFRVRCETDFFRLALGFFGGCRGGLACRTRFGRIAYR
jgi:hypothetical protein